MGQYENPTIITDRSSEILAAGIMNVGDIISKYASTVVAKNKQKAKEDEEVDSQIDKVRTWQYSAEAKIMDKFGEGNGNFMNQIKPLVKANLGRQGEIQLKLARSKDRAEKDALLSQMATLEDQFKKNVEGVQNFIIDVQTAAKNPKAVYLNSPEYNSAEIFTGLNTFASGQPGDISVSENENGTWGFTATPKGGPGGSEKPVSFNSGWYADGRNKSVTNESDIIDQAYTEAMKTSLKDGKFSDGNFTRQALSTIRVIKNDKMEDVGEQEGTETIDILDPTIFDKPIKTAAIGATAQAFGIGAQALDKQAAYKKIAREGDPTSYDEFMLANSDLSDEQINEKLTLMTESAIYEKTHAYLNDQFNSKKQGDKVVYYKSVSYTPTKEIKKLKVKAPTETELKYSATKKKIEGLAKEGKPFYYKGSGNLKYYISRNAKGQIEFYEPDESTGAIVKVGKDFTDEEALEAIKGVR
jgi:hypothetical protein